MGTGGDMAPRPHVVTRRNRPGPKEGMCTVAAAAMLLATQRQCQVVQALLPTHVAADVRAALQEGLHLQAGPRAAAVSVTRMGGGGHYGPVPCHIGATCRPMEGHRIMLAGAAWHAGVPPHEVLRCTAMHGRGSREVQCVQ